MNADELRGGADVLCLPTESEPVRVVEGDCLEVMRGMADGCVDAVVTDPPYLTGEAEITYEHAGVCERTAPTTTVGMPWGYSLDWVDECARFRPLHWVVFCHYLMLAGVIQSVSRHAKLSSVFTWRKSNAPNMTRPVPRHDCEFIVWARSAKATCGAMGEFRSLVLDVPMPQAGCMASERVLDKGTGKAAHPCQKPLAVVRPFVRRLPAATILDPFAGSGTTGVAAIAEGRRAILIERDAAYAAICRRRVAEAMGLGAGSLLAGLPARTLFPEDTTDAC